MKIHCLGSSNVPAEIAFGGFFIAMHNRWVSTGISIGIRRFGSKDPCILVQKYSSEALLSSNPEKWELKF